jgi:hypothetical protein
MKPTKRSDLFTRALIKVIPYLDYSCFPAILQVNRSLRTPILANCAQIVQDRALDWYDDIPIDEQYDINEQFLGLFTGPGKQKPKVNRVKLSLLMGAEVDYRPEDADDYQDAFNAFLYCIQYTFLDLADLCKRGLLI